MAGCLAQPSTHLSATVPLPGVKEGRQSHARPDPNAGEKWIVVVYDNDVNTYEQVMTVLMVATGCTSDEAYMEAWEIDHLGSSVVHRASEEECNEVAAIIATIGIRVEVCREWERVPN